MVHNIVEQIFGILKAHFTILTACPCYNLDIVAWLPLALAALHNFIWIHDPNEISDFLQEDPVECVVGELADGFPNAAERHVVNEWWDEIAKAMWAQYQAYQMK